jgi:hypothetical protein
MAKDGVEMAFRQAVACLGSFYEFPAGAAPEIRQKLDSERSGLLAWYTEFSSDIEDARLGYPAGVVRTAPDLEDQLLELAGKAFESMGAKRKNHEPALCLTHDIDYLQPTLQMRLKKAVGERKLSWPAARGTYLESIEKLLACDARAAGRGGVSTVFVASPSRVLNPARRAAQWLLDPSYSAKDAEFARLKDLIRRQACEVGIHGSFFSIERGLLREETERLAVDLGLSVKVSRQHWLNLPAPVRGRALEYVLEAGLRVDSTLGWNGRIGFRCGMARPFAIELESGARIAEIPMVIMDGALFEGLQGGSDEAVQRSTAMLDEVYRRRGCVAINWHDRAADPEYGWYDAYEKILDWARSKGFKFLTVSQGAAEFGANSS